MEHPEPHELLELHDLLDNRSWELGFEESDIRTIGQITSTLNEYGIQWTFELELYPLTKWTPTEVELSAGWWIIHCLEEPMSGWAIPVLEKKESQ